MIDDETKWIIEKIFSLAYQGYGSAKITKQLRAEKVPTASWLNFTRYGTFAHIFEGKPESKRYEWTIAHVKAILKSEVYIGNSVHNIVIRQIKRCLFRQIKTGLSERYTMV